MSTRHVHERERTELGRQPPIADHARYTTVRTSHRGWQALTVVVAVIGGMVLLVMGAVALARAGVSGSWNEPVVEVNGWPHTATLGVLELVAGAALILVALSSHGSLVVGAVIAAFGAVALIEPTVIDDRLTIDRDHAWLVVAIGAAALLASTIAILVRQTARREVTEEYVDAPTTM